MVVVVVVVVAVEVVVGSRHGSSSGASNGSGSGRGSDNGSGSGVVEIFCRAPNRSIEHHTGPYITQEPMQLALFYSQSRAYLKGSGHTMSSLKTRLDPGQTL